MITSAMPVPIIFSQEKSQPKCETHASLLSLF